MSKVDIENLIYKKPNLEFGLFSKIHYSSIQDPSDEGGEEELPLPTQLPLPTPTPTILPGYGDGSGQTGIGGE